MPRQLEEETLVNVFADVHFFFNDRTHQPQHHRFDKGSYVYVHHNGSTGNARMEIANNAGTPQQDACFGSLSHVFLSHSYKRPCFVTATITRPSHHPSPPPWLLPTFDLRNEHKYLYPLHSIDIYFWVPEDARDFLTAMKTCSEALGGLDVQTPHTHAIVHTKEETAKLEHEPKQKQQHQHQPQQDAPPPQSNAEVRRSPENTNEQGYGTLPTTPTAAPRRGSLSITPSKDPAESIPPPRNSVSPVVQMLEQAAVTSPYQHAAMADNRKPLPPPPPPQSPAQQHQMEHQPQYQQRNSQVPSNHSSGPPRDPSSPRTSISHGTTEMTPTYIPLAYNPASPAKPEPISAREKTPPPADLESGTGLDGRSGRLNLFGVQSTASSQPPPSTQQQALHSNTVPASAQNQYQYQKQNLPPVSASGQPSRTSISVPPSSMAQHQPQHYQQHQYQPQQRYTSPAPPPPLTPSKFNVSSPAPSHNQPHTNYPASSSTAASISAGAPASSQSYSSEQHQQLNIPPSVIYAAGLPQHPFAATPEPRRAATVSTTAPPPSPPSFAPPPTSATPMSFAPPPSSTNHYNQNHKSEQYQDQNQNNNENQNIYSIHQQVYTPSEAEFPHGPSSSSQNDRPPSKLEARTKKMEGGMNRLLKKLDKGW